MNNQIILKASDTYIELDKHLTQNTYNKIFLVCDNAMIFLRINNYFNSLKKRVGCEIIRFSDFEPNPRYDSVVKGVSLFNKEKCDLIVAVGGGSAIDVAKCIKLYSNMDSDKNYLEQKIIPNKIRLLAVPTTAGTGSEATRYAVIYYNGEKQSISNDSCIPSAVLMDPSVLITLPEYQKRSTMLDALCHSIEAFWSINSTEESKKYSKEAIRLILNNKDGYIANDEYANENMLRAAYIAGKAINITQTTAGHAMCYKLTSLYGIAHGHAAALCITKLWPYIVSNTNKCIDPRGVEYLELTLREITQAMGCCTSEEAIRVFTQIVNDLDFKMLKAKNICDYDTLKNSVNPVRLGNNPIALDSKAIDDLYHQILA